MECSKCGKESMSFSCKYCGEKFCSEHRLPENHDCQGLEEGVEEEKEESKKWFSEQEVKNPAPSEKPSTAYSKPSWRNEFKRIFGKNYTLSIILVTSFIFFIQTLIGSGNTLSDGFYSLFILQPALEKVVSQPWTLLTVMFLHGGLFHLFANMITFYFFGTPIEKAVKGLEFLKFYFGAGIMASIGFVLFRNLLYLLHNGTLTCILPGACGGTVSVLGAAVGASGAVVAAFAAVSMIYPDAEVLLYFVFPMKIKTALYLFGVFEGLNMLVMLAGYTIPVIGGLAFSAHFSGLLVGIWYGKKLRGRIGTRRARFDLTPR